MNEKLSTNENPKNNSNDTTSQKESGGENKSFTKRAYETFKSGVKKASDWVGHLSNTKKGVSLIIGGIAGIASGNPALMVMGGISVAAGVVKVYPEVKELVKKVFFREGDYKEPEEGMEIKRERQKKTSLSREEQGSGKPRSSFTDIGKERSSPSIGRVR